MRFFLLSILLGCALVGCAHLKNPHDGQLLEVEAQLVTGCAMVGVISETADAGNPFPFAATNKMNHRVKQRAMELGATHLVWLHKTNLSAAAEAYRCSLP
jgi:hypothetical protein